MSRKTTISQAASFGDECADYIQNTYESTKYGVKRFCKQSRRGRQLVLKFNNATSTGGAFFRGIFGLNVCGSLNLRIAGNDLRIKVTGNFWAQFVRMLVLSLGLYGWYGCILDMWMLFFWPFSVTAIIGSFMQKAFLDRVYNDTLGWLATSSINRREECEEENTPCVAGETGVSEGQLEYSCPHCGVSFAIDDDAEGYQAECPGCGESLDLTELPPL